MEISLTGIEQAVEGLGYRSDKSPKSRLVYTLKKHYFDSGAVESVKAFDTDALINLMWELDGDEVAIRSKRKNLSSIKSSVNADLDEAWELGCNPEGITIGPLNTFIMSDAAKDKILNSFSGAMDLEGGNTLDRVTEALKIVSEYLSNLPGGLEDDKLSNLKSLVEGLAEKFKEGGPGEFEIIKKKTDGTAAGEERAEDDAEIEEITDEDLDDAEAVIDDAVEEDKEAIEPDDTQIIEVMDEEDDLDTPDEVELVDQEESVEDADDGEELLEDETEIEEIAEEDLDDYEEVIEDDMEAIEPDDTEIIEVMAEDDDLDEPDEVELVDEEESVEDADDGEELLEDETEIEEIAEGDTDDIDAVIEQEAEEYLESAEIDELESDEPNEVELVDEDEVLNDVGEDAEALDDDAEIEEIAEEGLDDIEEVVEEEAEDLDEDDLVEVMDEVDASELDEAEIIEDEDVLEEADEAESTDAVDDTEFEDEPAKDDVGLPLDQLSEDALNFEEFQPDEEQKRLLAERFDGYLGAMERYYNQYIIINKGKYTVGADETGVDVLEARQVFLPDYYMGKYPVTNSLFEVFIERTGYKTTAETLGFGYVYYGRFQKTVDLKTGLSRSIWNPSYTRKKVAGAAWYQPTGSGSTLHQKRNHPVVQVSIKDARTFAAWTGKRLPTEIEWEAAARTRSGFIYPWGNEWRDGCCNSENNGLSDTCPVDTHPQGNNAAGIADLLGNVLEWTADECEPKYPLEKPTRFFIAKGGSWANHEQTRLFERTRFEAEFTANIVGFRCLAD